MSQTNVCCDDRCCHWATGGDGTAHVSQQSNRERGQEELRFTVLRTFSADLINIYRHTWTDPDFEVPLAALQTPSCHQHPVDIRDHGRMICSYDISKGTQKLPRSKVKYFPKTRFNVHVQRCKFGANPTGVALDHACDARKAKTFLLLFPHTASAKDSSRSRLYQDRCARCGTTFIGVVRVLDLTTASPISMWFHFYVLRIHVFLVKPNGRRGVKCLTRLTIRRINICAMLSVCAQSPSSTSR